jgi:2-polyprenyl-6-methoxyphenol hydroxylase-like FAD-dependent oxidoreductase
VALVCCAHFPCSPTRANSLSATTPLLPQLGVPVVVLERAPSLRQEGSAVSLWANAWRGLDALGVSDQLRQHSLLLDR